jgi:hypothetical protein
MVAQVHKTADGYSITLSDDEIAALNLSDGSIVRITPVDAAPEPGRQIRYATEEEVRESSQRTMPRHAAAYRELAK